MIVEILFWNLFGRKLHHVFAMTFPLCLRRDQRFRQNRHRQSYCVWSKIHLLPISLIVSVFIKQCQILPFGAQWRILLLLPRINNSISSYVLHGSPSRVLFLWI